MLTIKTTKTHIVKMIFFIFIEYTFFSSFYLFIHSSKKWLGIPLSAVPACCRLSSEIEKWTPSIAHAPQHTSASESSSSEQLEFIEQT